QLVLVGVDGGGPIVAAARAVAPDAIDRAVIDTGGFRFGQVLDLRSPDFLPGGAKYGDVAGLLALGATAPALVLGEKQSIPGVTLASSADPKAARDEALRFVLSK